MANKGGEEGKLGPRASKILAGGAKWPMSKQHGNFNLASRGR
jgi:hypothetical protein